MSKYSIFRKIIEYKNIVKNGISHAKDSLHQLAPAYFFGILFVGGALILNECEKRENIHKEYDVPAYNINNNPILARHLKSIDDKFIDDCGKY